MTDLSKLSDEEVNEALAILTGWIFRPCEGKGRASCRGWLVSADFRKSVTLWKDGSTGGDALPRFASSLDEVAKVEAGLSEEHRFEYFERYLPATSGAQTRDQGPLDFALFAGATARQRAEALIATLQP